MAPVSTAATYSGNSLMTTNLQLIACNRSLLRRRNEKYFLRNYAGGHNPRIAARAPWPVLLPIWVGLKAVLHSKPRNKAGQSPALANIITYDFLRVVVDQGFGVQVKTGWAVFHALIAIEVVDIVTAVRGVRMQPIQFICAEIDAFGQDMGRGFDGLIQMHRGWRQRVIG